jgi:hypothetical protein
MEAIIYIPELEVVLGCNMQVAEFNRSKLNRKRTWKEGVSSALVTFNFCRASTHAALIVWSDDNSSPRPASFKNCAIRIWL